MDTNELARQDSVELAEVDSGMSQLDWERYQEDMRDLEREGYFDNGLDDRVGDDHEDHRAEMDMIDDEPDRFLDAAYEERTELGDDF